MPCKDYNEQLIKAMFRDKEDNYLEDLCILMSSQWRDSKPMALHFQNIIDLTWYE